jgi:hypothetical protein
MTAAKLKPFIFQNVLKIKERTGIKTSGTVPKVGRTSFVEQDFS